MVANSVAMLNGAVTMVTLMLSWTCNAHKTSPQYLKFSQSNHYTAGFVKERRQQTSTILILLTIHDVNCYCVVYYTSNSTALLEEFLK